MTMMISRNRRMSSPESKLSIHPIYSPYCCASDVQHVLRGCAEIASHENGTCRGNLPGSRELQQEISFTRETA
jgi:hypothetical protein